MVHVDVVEQVLGQVVGVAHGHRCADGTHHLVHVVLVVHGHVLGERDFGEAELAAVGTRERLRLDETLAAVVELVVGARQYALHRMRCQVLCGAHALLVTRSAQIEVVADETFVPLAAEVVLRACVTAHSFTNGKNKN